jgi:hypothetical protein
MTASLTFAMVSSCSNSVWEGLGTYVGDGNRLFAHVTKILEHVLDEDRALDDVAVDLKVGIVGGGEADLLVVFLGGGRHVVVCVLCRGYGVV